MPHFEPELIAQWTGGCWTTAPVTPIRGFTMDSRQLAPGQTFVALATEKRDGHDFLEAAQAAGASAAIVSRPKAGLSLPQLVVADPLKAFQTIAREHRRRFQGPVIGISGSCGKTSTKELLALLLGAEEGVVLSTEGNLNNHIGVPLSLVRLEPGKHRFAVIEAGISGPGEMDLLAGLIEPDMALITLVAPAHLEELGGLEGVAREKSRLPAALRATGMAIFPRQCADFAAFRDLSVPRMIVEPAEVLRPTEPPRDTVYFTITQRDETTAISVAYGMPPPLQFTLGRVSPGMAQNVVLAICAALWLGVGREDIQRRLSRFRPAHWRGEVLRDAQRLYYVDCYNANPASMRDALQNFHGLEGARGPRLYVLGCMEELGAFAGALHQELGRSLTLRAGDVVCVIGAQAEELRRGLLEAGASEEQVRILPGAEAAAAVVAAWTGAVFVKGSRKYRLENTLPSTVAPRGAAH